LTDIPNKLQAEENIQYLLSVIDTFSKFVDNYILNNKMGDAVLGYLKDFINKNGKPNSIHTDKGKEFCNKLIEDYCKDNNINIIHGCPYHQQSKGVFKDC
jgi:transposase InsO family protein